MAQIPYMNWMGDQPTGSAYDVYQYYLGGGSPGGTPAGGGGTGIASLPWYLQTGGRDGRDGGGGGGYGLFGNLDKSTEKIFNKNVWAGEIGGPGNMYGGWKPQEVKGYQTPSGWKTYEGKNIDHLGLEVPTMAGMLFDKNFGKGPQIGDIEGTFSKGWESGKGKIKKGWEEEKEKIFGIKKRKAKKEEKLQKEIKDFNERKWKEAQAEKQAEAQRSQGAADAARVARAYREETGGQAGSYAPGGGSGAHAADVSGSTYTDPFDPGGGEKEGGLIRKAQGGMVKDLTKDPEYRGWKKMYEMNPELGSMHNKHPAFIKFYKQHERDQKKFGGLAGLLYG
jgi:hypothetical protein